MSNHDSFIIATVQLLPSQEGRSRICLDTVEYYGCPIFWPNDERFKGQGNDVRMYLTDSDTSIDADHTTTVKIRFLNPEIIQLLHAGMEFRMWESKDIGNGTVIEIVRYSEIKYTALSLLTLKPSLWDPSHIC